MAIVEVGYKLDFIPDLSLNKYAALEESGISGVLEQHLIFLRQWNRKGLMSGISMHLLYYYDGMRIIGETVSNGGERLKVYLMIRGDEKDMGNVGNLIRSSSLSEYYKFSKCTPKDFLNENNLEGDVFSACCVLMKKEMFLKSTLENIESDSADYYLVPQWEMNDNGRLYNMFKIMEATNKQSLYRVDVYPVNMIDNLRNGLRKPMAVLRERRYSRGFGSDERDYEAERVLKDYEDMIENFESTPHFAVNIFSFADKVEDAELILDAAGAEALSKGNYNIGRYVGRYSAFQFIEKGDNEITSVDDRYILQKTNRGMVCCKKQSRTFGLRYLPTLFSLDDLAPFFRFPALYEGECIQIKKETAPQIENKDAGLYLGVDDNGYDVYFPIKNLTKHAFIAGVPGSGKTNTMHHLASVLLDKEIPFLVFEPAKQEYRALANQKGMEGLYIFSPNADMLFPLHINPFQFPRGIILAEHIRKLCQVFEGAFPLENPMPFLLDTAIEAVYRECGWTPEMEYTNDVNLKFPTIGMLYKRLEKELETTKYSDEIRGNLESALKVRIGSLLRREMGDVFDVQRSTLEPEEWLKVPAVIELEAMGTGPANFLTLMLCTLIRETLKVNPHYDKDRPRHVIFIEEAHNLIGPVAEETSGNEADPKTAATAFIVKMLAEVRALKEGIVIADQLPTVMAPEVIKNTGLKIGLRITSSDDRNLLGSTMSANDVQIEEMATFNVGRSLVSYEGLMKPFSIQTHEWCGNWNQEYCSGCVENRSYVQCQYYLSGKCEPDRKERELITVSKDDKTLVQLMASRECYIKMCEESFSIEAKKLVDEFGRLLKKYREVILPFYKEMQELKNRISEKTDLLMIAIQNTEGGETDIDEIVKRHEEAAKEIHRMTCDLDLYKTKKIYKETKVYIDDWFYLLKSIDIKLRHFKKLGIAGFKGNYVVIVDTPQIREQVNALKMIEKSCIQAAQGIFAYAKNEFTNMDEYEQKFEWYCERFKIQTQIVKKKI